MMRITKQRIDRLAKRIGGGKPEEQPLTIGKLLDYLSSGKPLVMPTDSPLSMLFTSRKGRHPITTQRH